MIVAKELTSPEWVGVAQRNWMVCTNWATKLTTTKHDVSADRHVDQSSIETIFGPMRDTVNSRSTHWQQQLQKRNTRLQNIRQPGPGYTPNSNRADLRKELSTSESIGSVRCLLWLHVTVLILVRMMLLLVRLLLHCLPILSFIFM